MKFTGFVVLGAAVIAAASPNGHIHRHADMHARHVKARADVTTVVEGPTVTQYVMANGQVLSADQVAAGVKAGIYKVLSDSSASSVATSSAPPSSTSLPSKSSSSGSAGEFYQQGSSTTTSTVAAATSAIAPASSSSAPAPAASVQANSAVVSPGGTGLNANFPSGTIPCSTFPSAYGAITVDYLGLGGWIGIQECPKFKPGDASISYIVTGIAGYACKAGDFCSYACPAGYQKTQWPAAQGNTGQSIGGLYCNSNGMLELSNPSMPTLCMKGSGGVFIDNQLKDIACLCRTDYPGTEGETIPLQTSPGNKYEVTCPDAGNYYKWQGASTSAQYYLNNEGVGMSGACQWGTAGSNAGNWAPMNLGVGKANGNIYISMFPNTPTNDLSVTLNYNVKIVGDVSGDCKYVNGVYYNNGVVSATGCTVLVTGTATYVLTDR